MVASIRWDAWSRCCARATVQVQLSTLRVAPPHWATVLRERLALLWTDPAPAPVSVRAPAAPTRDAITAPMGAPPWTGERWVQPEA